MKVDASRAETHPAEMGRQFIQPRRQGYRGCEAFPGERLGAGKGAWKCSPTPRAGRPTVASFAVAPALRITASSSLDGFQRWQVWGPLDSQARAGAWLKRVNGVAG